MGFGGSSGGNGGTISGSNDAAMNNPIDGQVIAWDGATAKWKNSSNTGGDNSTVQQIVRWNSATSQWGTRPVGAAYGVLFISTDDANAPAPSDVNLANGDVWRRHPDAV